MSTSELHPFFQKRFFCPEHGYFDVMTAKKLKESSRPKCPTCQIPAYPREGYECTGKTTQTLPIVTRPRLQEYLEFEFPELGTKGFRQPKRKSRERRGFEVGPKRGGSFRN